MVIVFTVSMYAPLMLLFKTEPSLGIMMHRVFDGLDGLRSTPPTLFSINLKSARAWKGLAYVGTSVILLIGAILTMAGGAAVAFLAGSPLLLSSRAMYRSAERYFQHNADYILKQDDRKRILLLRSHEQDLLTIEPRIGSLLSLKTRSTLEEIIALELKMHGPFVALGNNDEEKPPLGANRQYFNNQSWKDIVSIQMANSRFIVLVIGLTEGVIWEIKRAIELDVVSKLIIVFPYIDIEIQSQHWDLLSELFSETRWGQGFSDLRQNKTLFLLFSNNGEVIEITGNKDNQLSYEIGMVFSLYCMFYSERNNSLTFNSTRPI